MRIISPFHDYYDSVQKYGSDPECRYIRKHTEHKETILSNIADSLPGRPNMGININTYTLLIFGIAGAIYPALQFMYTRNNKENKAECRRIVYTIQDLDAFALEQPASRNMVEYWRRRHVIHYFSDTDRNNFNHKNLALFFNTWSGKRIDDNTFIRLGAPVFLESYSLSSGLIGRHHTCTVHINPRLADYEFYRVMDPVTIYQNIYQYLSGVIGNNMDPADSIPDRTKIMKHGFDDWSFRTRGGTKRRKGRA